MRTRTQARVGSAVTGDRPHPPSAAGRQARGATARRSRPRRRPRRRHGSAAGRHRPGHLRRRWQAVPALAFARVSPATHRARTRGWAKDGLPVHRHEPGASASTSGRVARRVPAPVQPAQPPRQTCRWWC